MRRKKCSACGSSDLSPFLDLGSSPIADAYTATAEMALDSPTYPLEVSTCRPCGLAQLMEVVDHQTLFGTGYSFYSSASPPLSAYHAQYAADLIQRYPDQIAHGVLEIGCNDGDMLRHFAADPHLGIDPATGPVAVARSRHLNVEREAFTFDMARGLLRGKDGRGWGLIIANHVLAHVADVQDMLAGIAHLLHRSGVAVIEVQYLPDLLTNNAFDLVYHEHRQFFSLRSLMSAARIHGLRVIDAEMTQRQGGSLRATLVEQTSPVPLLPNSQADRIWQSERWLKAWPSVQIQPRVERVRTRLLALLEEANKRGEVALYGAPAKATTLLSFCGIGSTDLAYCWDTTVAKQGRFIPGAAIPIRAPHSPGDNPDTLLLAAWNYVGPILRENRGFDWIVPLPAPIELPS